MPQSDENLNLVAATLAAALADRLPRDPDYAQAIVDLYLRVREKLREASKPDPMQISDQALDRAKNLKVPRRRSPT